MEDHSFEKLVNQLSNEAEQVMREEDRLAALAERRAKIKQSAIVVLVVGLCVVVYFKRAEINDASAKFFHSRSDDSTNSAAADRKAKLMNTMKQAKESAAAADNVMNTRLDARAPAIVSTPDQSSVAVSSSETNILQGGLKNAIVKAKEHASVMDTVMQDNLDATASGAVSPAKSATNGLPNKLSPVIKVGQKTN